MCLNRKFLVISLIVYAVFQLYQVYSSFLKVFLDYKDHFNFDIKLLTVFHIVGLIISSVLLIVGALKSKTNLLLGALIYLLYKFGFIIWHIGGFYDITIGCRESISASSCDPNRLSIIYLHIFISGEFNLEFLKSNDANFHSLSIQFT